MRRRLPLTLAVSLALISPALAQDIGPDRSEQVPLVGRDGPELDACGGIGRLSTYEADLAVFERPEDYAREKDRLPVSTLVWLCDGNDDYQGVVYPSGDFQELGDCQVSIPIAEPEPYSGPCEFGWVTARNIRLVAG